MPFNTLLLTSLTSKTSFAESGGRVSVEAESGEVVLFFNIDNEIARQGLNIQGLICCDCLVFYAREAEKKKILCLVELKGSNLKHAVKQITTTHKHLKEALQHSSGRDHLKHVTWKAYIFQHGQSPKDTIRYKAQLEEAFGKNNVEILRKEDIGPFLRK